MLKRKDFYDFFFSKGFGKKCKQTELAEGIFVNLTGKTHLEQKYLLLSLELFDWLWHCYLIFIAILVIPCQFCNPLPQFDNASSKSLFVINYGFIDNFTAAFLLKTKTWNDWFARKVGALEILKNMGRGLGGQWYSLRDSS